MTDLLHGWYVKRIYPGGGKSGPAAPPPPDYRGAALEQAAASKELAQQQTFANRPTLNTPWGQMAWTAGAGTDPSTGMAVTNWTGNLNLTPEQQNALDAQQRIQQGRSYGAETLLPQAISNFQQQFNWADLPDRPRGAQAALNPEAAQQRAYGIMSQMLEPGRQQQQQGLETKLANMGLPRGSEAWTREMANLRGQFDTQDKAMMAQALAEGRANAAQLFQQGAGSIEQQAKLRQQGLSEEQLRRGMSLNELNALLTGQQVQQPNMPSFSQASAGQAPNLLGAAQAQGNYDMNAAQLAASGGGSDWGSLLGTAGGIAMQTML